LSTSRRSTPGPTCALSRRVRDETGAATASFVILFPLLLLMFMALVQWGLYFHAQSLVDAAAQDGGRAARDAGGTPEDGRAVADQLLGDATGSGLLEQVTVDIADTDGVIRATVRGQVRSLVPLPGFDLTVEGVSEGPAERFVPESDR
jgi:Flp pilus assembly protein TadG